MDADRAVQRRNLQRQHTRRRHLSWVAGALAVGLSALIVASLLTRPHGSWTSTGDGFTHRVSITSGAVCAPIRTMYVDESPERCEQR